MRGIWCTLIFTCLLGRMTTEKCKGTNRWSIDVSSRLRLPEVCCHICFILLFNWKHFPMLLWCGAIAFCNKWIIPGYFSNKKYNCKWISFSCQINNLFLELLVPTCWKKTVFFVINLEYFFHVFSCIIMAIWALCQMKWPDCHKIRLVMQARRWLHVHFELVPQQVLASLTIFWSDWCCWPHLMLSSLFVKTSSAIS